MAHLVVTRTLRLRRCPRRRLRRLVILFSLNDECSVTVCDGRPCHGARDRGVTQFWGWGPPLTHENVGVDAEKRGITVSAHAESGFDSTNARRSVFV